MGTRGIIGFVVDGEEKISYNHYDSYPSGVGLTVLEWLKSLTGTQLEAARDLARALQSVDEAIKPTPEQRATLAHFHDPNVSEGDDWYSVLRRTQGSPGLILEAGFYGDACKFPMDSLFCEWGYVIDFDKAVFEVYRGFQKEDHADGRFAGREVTDQYAKNNGYRPIRLVGSFSLERLPTEDDFLQIQRKEYDDED